MAVSMEIRIMEKEAQLVAQSHSQMLQKLEIARMVERKVELEEGIAILEKAMEKTRGDIEILKKGGIIN